MTRVVIADDSVLFRAAAVRLLEDAGFDVVAQAGCADDLLRKVRAHQPDVAIVDICMPPNHGDDGLQAACVIRSELPRVGVLVLSHHVEPQYACELLEHGAEGVGYLLKDRVTDVDRFTDAVRALADRGSVLDPMVVAQMVGRHPASGLDGLSVRERDVLAQIAVGATNRAIARRLYLSERAVERHVTAIFDALGLAASRHVHRRVLAALAHRKVSANSQLRVA
jgi:DNA-binding NarL/FixJ family response regulator